MPPCLKKMAIYGLKCLISDPILVQMDKYIILGVARPIA